MDENLKYIIALILGTLISPLWTRFLGRKKTELEESKLRSDECLNTLELFKESLKEYERINAELKKEIAELKDKNDKTVSYFNNKIAELTQVNTYQTQKIMNLDAEVKKCANARKKSTSKKKPSRKTIA